MRIGVCVPRGPEMVVSLLGVLEAGGAYVPLDATYPAERIAFMLEDSEAPVVLATAETRDRLPLNQVDHRLDPEPVVIDPTEISAPSPDDPPDTPPQPAPATRDRLAYVIYTSGSTGRPKGVAISHGAACALLRWASGVFSRDELDGVLAGTSICFDLSVFELFLPLAAGGRVVLAEDALGAAAHAATGEVRLINTVPSAMKELVASGRLPESVRTVNLAGEPLQRALVDGIYRSRPEVERVYNLYGPSEDTTYSTVARADRDDPDEPTIGVPVAGGRAHVLDRRLRPVPLGVPGELCLAGAGLARGYLGRPGRTAGSFVPDPFAAVDPGGGSPGGRLYRTGDLARWGRDGELEFLGRLDHQVKIRGFRIELGEIEAALNGHPRVDEATVVAAERAGEPALVAYVVPSAEAGAGAPSSGSTPGSTPESTSESASEEAPLSETLRAALDERLPSYMVPAAFVELDALPRTPNGKLDRKALPAPEWEAGTGGRAPTTPTEERLAELFADVLGLPETDEGPTVGADQDFFRLGGHSLLATRLITRLREALGADLPVTAVFEAPTVAGLARRVDEALRQRPDGPGGEEIAPIPRRPDPSEAPVSFAQERLWFLAQLDADAATYNMPAAVRMEGRLNLPALAGALRDLTARHEALRTELVTPGEGATGEPGGPVQRILPADGVTVRPGVADLSGLPPERRREEARTLAAREAGRAVALDRAPLMRTAVLRLGAGDPAEEHVFVIVLHHAISDGWSLGIFVRELASLYGARTGGPAAALPPRPVQYGDFALWQRRSLTEDVLDDLLGWWRDELAGAPTMLELPADRPRPSSPTTSGGVVRVPVPAELGRRLEALGRERTATLFMVLAAGFGALLSRTSGQQDLVLGAPSAGRDRSDLEDSLGLFVDTVALRVRLDDEPTLSELIERVRDSALGAFAHQRLPFDRLVDELVPERRPGVPPLIQVMLALQNAPMGPLELPGLRLERIPVESGTAKFDLA
ncbi:MAG: amino acid adenylation domain-containing protein, partial [Acidobacteriota bacterium]